MKTETTTRAGVFGHGSGAIPDVRPYGARARACGHDGRDGVAVSVFELASS